MGRYFGTDGVRGVAGEKLTGALAFALGQSAVELLGKDRPSPDAGRAMGDGRATGAERATGDGRAPSEKPCLVIGRDTRASGGWLEDALVAGIEAGGGQALLAGIIPTPAVALLVRATRSAGGVVISASHNPPEYNGIKFFDAEGYKLSAEVEAAFEQQLAAMLDAETGQGTRPADAADVPDTSAPTSDATPAPTSGSAPTSTSDTFSGAPATPIPDAAERYIAHAVATVRNQGFDLAGLKVAVDCGHGAAHYTTPEALRQLGAEVFAINTSYDGTDINVGCGSTNLSPIRALVAETGADIGLAHDGDADRLIAVDAAGNEIDGDFIEAICAIDLKTRGLLPKNTVVSTVMCNLGFTLAMREHGIEVLQTDVGDSNVLAAMRAGGYTVGGEQSGHMIFLEHNSTGDGLITALQLLAAMRRSGKSLSELAQAMRKCPQVLINVKGVDKTALAAPTAATSPTAAAATIAAAVAEAEARLSATGGGRVLLRPSGTEPLIRVMVEAPNEATAQQEAQALAELVKRELGR